MWSFLHIPKCGGTSIRRSLINKIKYCGHVKASSIDGKVFTFIRNPIARFISAYNYIKDGNAGLSKSAYGRKILPAIHETSDINEFVQLFVDNILIQQHKHFLPMLHFIDRDIDFIGKIENMNEDFIKLCNIINLKNIEIMHINCSTIHGDLNCKSNLILQDFYHDDIYKLYGGDI